MKACPSIFSTLENFHSRTHLKKFLITSQVAAADERQKKYMRFGKRYMRFGKREDGDEDNLEEDKRYMRFGKREDGDEMDEDKRYMRFGRAQEVLDGMDEEKRYMRFGRAQEPDKR